jgi:hypothetical protein
MGVFTLTETEKILSIVEHLISKDIKISVDMQGCDEQFSTRVIKLKKEAGQGCLIIERLYPEPGNSLIESYQDVMLAFEMSGSRCVFATRYLGINAEYPEFGLKVALPSTIQIEERREEERIEDDLSEFLWVEFTLGGKVYRLKAISVGASGIGLVVDRESSDLLGKLNVGDTMRDMRFFLPQALLTVDGTVKHKTQISSGRLKGNHVLGIESGFIAGLEELKESLKKKT